MTDLNTTQDMRLHTYTPPRIEFFLVEAEQGFAKTSFDDGELSGENSNNLPDWE